MMVELNGIIQSVRLLTDIIKANKSLTNFNELISAVAEVNAKLSAAWSVALASQEKQATLSQHIGELEKEITTLKDWNREAERYQLTEIASGVLAYGVKPGMDHGEPLHHLCANCFANNKKSFLQNGPPDIDPMFRCTQCGSSWFPQRP